MVSIAGTQAEEIRELLGGSLEQQLKAASLILGWPVSSNETEIMVILESDMDLDAKISALNTLLEVVTYHNHHWC